MTALPPGSTIGILGAGQLGRMLALAAPPLGLRCHVYSDEPGPAFDVVSQATVGSFADEDRLAAFARSVDVVTYEFENVPVAAAELVARIAPVRPGVPALAATQDRLSEKLFLRGLGLPTAPFAPVDQDADIAAAVAALGLPAILKSRRLGYDGKGQARIATPADMAAAHPAIGHAPAVLEGFVSFAYEVSVIVVRALSGEIQYYDCPLNTHESGILRTSVVPSPLSPAETARSQEIAARIVTALDYTGTLAVELFYLGPDAAEPLVVNELAPRVHNSGHWTLDACAVSQFENHIRAIAGWPLGSTSRHSDAVMTNLIGDEVHAWPELAKEADTCLHLYGKHDARAGRKMGHATRLISRG